MRSGTYQDRPQPDNAVDIHMAPRPSYAFYGHHKCATMTFNTIVGSVCRRLGLRSGAVYDEFQFEGDLNKYLQTKKIDFLCYGNADYEYVRQLPPHKAFHIVRDPRDIVVSAYYSHRYSHATGGWPELVRHRELLSTLSVEDGIAEEIRFRARSFQQMLDWDFENPDILEIRFEDFTKDDTKTLIATFEFLGLLDDSDYDFAKRLAGTYREMAAFLAAKTPLSIPPRFLGNALPVPDFFAIAWRNRFAAKARGRRKGTADVRSHYRKGQSGEWSDVLTTEHKDLFKSLYPDLVPKLGYAADDNW